MMTTTSPTLWPRLAAFLGAALLAGSALAAPLKIGVVPGIFADSVEAAAKEAKKQGLDVQVVEFTDWATPNVALDAGDIDLNYYQNSNYLANAARSKGFKFTSVQAGILSYLGLYSTRHKSLADLPTGAKVAIASDPVNVGRGLRLLQHAGLITLRPDTGLLGTQADIVSNPRKLQFVEIEGPQLARTTPDVDLAQGFSVFHHRLQGLRCQQGPGLHQLRGRLLGHPVRGPQRPRGRPAHRPLPGHLQKLRRGAQDHPRLLPERPEALPPGLVEELTQRTAGPAP